MKISSLSPRVIIALLSIYLIWGSTYLAIRFGIETLPPFLMASTRFLAAGALLLFFSRVVRKDNQHLTFAHWRSGFIIGSLLLLGGNGGVVYAEQYVSSGLTALLISTVPIWMVIFSIFTGPKVKPRKPVVFGVIAGFAGLLYLVYYTTGISADSINPYGVAALVFATISWAYGSVITGSMDFPQKKLTTVALQMLGGGAALLVFSVITGDIFRLQPDAVSGKSLLALLYLTTFGSIIGYTAYIWLLEKVGPAKAATYAYVNPVVAIFLGWLFAGETFSSNVLIGAAIILTSVAIIISSKAKAVIKSEVQN